MKKDQIVIYKDENNSIQLDVRMEGEMLWLDRQQMATLYGRDYKTISKHINNALKEELAGSEEVVAKFATTTQHGAMKDKTQTHDKEYFNLEMVTSVGYRVKSSRGVMFRKWANKVPYPACISLGAYDAVQCYQLSSRTAYPLLSGYTKLSCPYKTLQHCQ